MLVWRKTSHSASSAMRVASVECTSRATTFPNSRRSRKRIASSFSKLPRGLVKSP